MSTSQARRRVSSRAKRRAHSERAHVDGAPAVRTVTRGRGARACPDDAPDDPEPDDSGAPCRPWTGRGRTAVRAGEERTPDGAPGRTGAPSGRGVSGFRGRAPSPPDREDGCGVAISRTSGRVAGSSGTGSPVQYPGFASSRPAAPELAGRVGRAHGKAIPTPPANATTPRTRTKRRRRDDPEADGDGNGDGDGDGRPILLQRCGGTGAARCRPAGGRDEGS